VEAQEEMSYLYLASPYTHKDRAVRLLRHRQAVKKAAQLMLGGAAVFSPIAHSHDIGLFLDRPVDHDFWMMQDLPLLKHADRLMVLRLDGWMESRGMAAEIEYAEANGIPIEYIDS
jgi:nucleoside 2-deoxyribosyltransferase